MLIDPCTELDRSGWLKLRQQLWPDCPAEEHTREIDAQLAEPARYAAWLARDMDGEPQGFVEVAIRRDHVNGTDSSPVLFLEGLYVAPAARRQGLARELVAMAAAWGAGHRCVEFASDTPQANAASRAAHLALGFEETEQVVYFRKLLTPSLDGTVQPPPASRELKAFVPALDFALAKRFYAALGMELIWSTDELAYFRQGPARFLLQPVPADARPFAEHFQMHLLVDDADAWWRYAAPVAERFGTRCDPPADRAWGMRDFTLLDPSGVCWRIGHALPGRG
jgi:aminoglycoside 6'-N-acetyltransferase I